MDGPHDDSDPSVVELLPIGKRRSLAEEAADQLRNLILLEKLAPGDPVRERQLAEGLDISRTPLREALRLLEIEGLVEYSPTRRPYVANPSLRIIEQNLKVLGVLEALAGEEACANATSAEIQEIGRLCETMRATSGDGDPLAFFRTDMAFHAAIVAASRNDPLLETQRHYNARLWRARYISSRRQPDRPRTLRQHQDVFEALERRDAQACASALRDHLRSAVVNIGTSFAEAERDRKDERTRA